MPLPIPTNHLYMGSVNHTPESETPCVNTEGGYSPMLLNMKYANRHGLISGATGTGKTVTLQVMAEQFAAAGVPVFVSDVKGDLAGLCAKSAMQDFLVKRANIIGLGEGYTAKAAPTAFWDLFGEHGHPLRTTVTEMGPLLLSNILELSDAQEGALNIAFRLADKQKMPLLDLKDLRALLQHVAENKETISTEYGLISTASIGAIQRQLLVLENQGAEQFFGEPALNIQDFMRTDSSGKGFVNVLASQTLMQHPRLYATFLLWLLSELFEELPEAGDQKKPKLVFFFDEAHLLFNNAPKHLIQKVEQVVKLIRSKGVGVFFVTQNPTDVPEAVLSQLGNKVQHALRAFTPKGQKDVKATAGTFRANPAFKTEDAITQLGVGEALVSTLEKKGIPTVVQRVLIRPPASFLGVPPAETVQQVRASSLLGRLYDEPIDRESAFEMLKKKKEVRLKAEAEAEKIEAAQEAKLAEEKAKNKSKGRSSRRQTAGEAFKKSMMRRVGTLIASEIFKLVKKPAIRDRIVRGVLGSMMR